MGDIMILNENEVKTCLEYGLKPFLNKYSIVIKETQLTINEYIEMKAVVAYQDHIFDMQARFTLSYQSGKLIFENIEGKVEYLFLQLSLLTALKQMIHDEHLIFKDEICCYVCDLPIRQISIKDKHLCIELETT